MKLRARLDVFSTALLSALGASSVVACGGTFSSGTGSGGASGSGAGNSGATSGAGPGGSTNIGGSTSIAGSTSIGGGTNRYPCTNPKDLGNGQIQCDTFTHRNAAKTCDLKLPRPEVHPNLMPPGDCEQDSDCTAHPYGWCGPGIQVVGYFCEYGCVQDSDCGANQLCQCADPVGRCVQATDCSTDADCGKGFFCKSYDSSGGCGLTTFSCQQPSDECAADSDCQAKVPSPGNLCVYDAAQHHFRCELGGCAIGRPFLVEGVQRIAPVSARADWRELALLRCLGELETTFAVHLGEQWTRVALMEHASIAAFARFSLQLLSLGAPPGLVERATSAMVDETKHAKACFAVASQYAGAPVGPGRLAVESSLNEMTLEEIVLNTIREGCIGETVAAIEAREAAEHANDPALRALLLVISEDETRHAELAFRFVKWALSQGDAALERAVRREFAALSEPLPAPRELDRQQTAVLRHGIVPEPMKNAIRARAISEVILPCSNALYAPRVSRAAEARLDTTSL